MVLLPETPSVKPSPSVLKLLPFTRKPFLTALHPLPQLPHAQSGAPSLGLYCLMHIESTFHRLRTKTGSLCNDLEKEVGHPHFADQETEFSTLWYMYSHPGVLSSVHPPWSLLWFLVVVF